MWARVIVRLSAVRTHSTLTFARFIFRHLILFIDQSIVLAWFLFFLFISLARHNDFENGNRLNSRLNIPFSFQHRLKECHECVCTDSDPRNICSISIVFGFQMTTACETVKHRFDGCTRAKQKLNLKTENNSIIMIFLARLFVHQMSEPVSLMSKRRQQLKKET